ncbi:hypothetical protein PRUPE_7G090200 [Prunus persica]|uniref:Uncharacterized protein n=2 Tax=Prunus TaxID=3754 RepID=A0A251N8W7_PRUPE|nr:uncharacterized protein LOC18769069 [Prunus persica]ONH95776.1 hypothetical protein PRUPE_7G090200 [Prunus persica]
MFLLVQNVLDSVLIQIETFFIPREREGEREREREREMDNSIGVGFMAVVAVSGSVVLLAHQVHKRLLSDFMKNIECEMGGLLDHHKKMASGSEKIQGKKCVRFAADVAEPSSNNKEYRKRRFAPTTKQAKEGNGNYKMDTMPLNRFYKR